MDLKIKYTGGFVWETKYNGVLHYGYDFPSLYPSIPKDYAGSLLSNLREEDTKKVEAKKMEPLHIGTRSVLRAESTLKTEKEKENKKENEKENKHVNYALSTLLNRWHKVVKGDEEQMIIFKSTKRNKRPAIAADKYYKRLQERIVQSFKDQSSLLTGKFQWKGSNITLNKNHEIPSYEHKQINHQLKLQHPRVVHHNENTYEWVYGRACIHCASAEQCYKITVSSVPPQVPNE